MDEGCLFSVLRESRRSAAAAAAAAASAPTQRAAAAATATAIHRTGRVLDTRRGEDRKLARDIFAMTERTLRLARPPGRTKLSNERLQSAQ
jgi:hypothetical protein